CLVNGFCKPIRSLDRSGIEDSHPVTPIGASIMGLQKYRAEIRGAIQKNGAIPYTTKFWGTLALVRNCPIRNTVIDTGITPRTVYVSGEADTFFSIPAACRYKGKTLRGYLTTDDNGDYEFRVYKNQGA